MSPTTPDILTLHRNATDGSLGRTLLRLAGLAETLHRHAGQRGSMNNGQSPVQGRTDRPTPGSKPGIAAGTVRTEVNR